MNLINQLHPGWLLLTAFVLAVLYLALGLGLILLADERRHDCVSARIGENCLRGMLALILWPPVVAWCLAASWWQQRRRARRWSW